MDDNIKRLTPEESAAYAAELRARLGLTPIGEQVELRVNRGGEARVLRVQAWRLIH